MDSMENKTDMVDSELKSMVASLYSYISKKLQIKSPPRIVFTKNNNNAKNPFGLTAYYDPEKKVIRVYITNRHNTDILRSFSHELIHHSQNEQGTLSSKPLGGHEHYAQNDPNLRKREMEAYLLGNMLFRDWQDAQRYGPIKEEKKKRKIRLSELRQIVRQRLLEFNLDDDSTPPSAFQKYEQLGTTSDDSHYCWYWNEKGKEVVFQQGGNHAFNFGNKPYENFRGRYNPATKNLTLVPPVRGPRSINITKILDKDVPKDLIKVLNKTFPGHILHYIPYRI